MNFLRANWHIIAALAAAVYFAGGQGNKIAAIENRIATIEDMRRDIAVIKQRVEWLAEQQLADNRRKNLDRSK